MTVTPGQAERRDLLGGVAGEVAEHEAGEDRAG